MLLQPILLVHRLAFWLDDFLFPALRDQTIERPVFVVGLPRSGTTFAHRLLAGGSETFTSMPLWELLFAPALCEKKIFWLGYRLDRAIGHPLSKLITFVQGRVLGEQVYVHPTDLSSAEEDYLGLLPFGGCFLQVLWLPHSSSTWRLGFFMDNLPAARRARLLKCYRGLVARHLYFRNGPTGQMRLLSKNPSFTAWLPALAREFPDASFIGLRRSPHACVPSQLSSLRTGLKALGYDVCEPQLVNKFVALLAYYWHLLEAASRELGPQRICLMEYEEFTRQPFQKLCLALEQLEISWKPQDALAVEQMCATASAYRSQHRYALSDFQLSEAQLDIAFGLHCESSLVVDYAPDSNLPGKVEA